MGQSSLFNFEEGRRPGTEESLQSRIDKINEEKRKTFDGLPDGVKGLFERANVLSEAKWKAIRPEVFTTGATHFFDTNKTALEQFDYQRPPSVQERGGFKTARDAAIAALMEINAKSIREDREYAGRVCKSDRTFFYTEPKRGNRDSSDFGFCPPGSARAASYHTHGAVDRRDPNNPLTDFSKGDIQIANREMLPTYKSDPWGNIKYYDPNKGKVNADGDPREPSDAGHFIRGVKAPTR